MRLSTIGRNVSDGKGLGRSEARGVCVGVAVGTGKAVALGRKGVSVTAGTDVFVGAFVATGVDGAGADVSVQASDLRM